MGFSEGMIALSNLAAQARVKTWIVSDQAKAVISKTPGVREIVYSPGEEVFLAVRSDGNIFLFSMQDQIAKMKFEKPQGGVSRISWIDTVSGDFLVASP